MNRIQLRLFAAALVVCASLPARAQYSPYHVPEGSTQVVPGWPKQTDWTDPLNISKYAGVLAYLQSNGFTGTQAIQTWTASPIPGFPAPPTYAVVQFACAGANVPAPCAATNRSDYLCSVHDYGLVLQMPVTLLVELENQCKFGDPAHPPQFNPPPPNPPAPAPTPLPPQPANPVGGEVFPGQNLGLYFDLPGDQLVCGVFFADPAGVKYQKVCQQSPFGAHVWWQKAQ